MGGSNELFYYLTFIVITVENRVLRPEQIIMGTSGTVLDWIMKKKVSHYSARQWEITYPQLNLLSILRITTTLPHPLH